MAPVNIRFAVLVDKQPLLQMLQVFDAKLSVSVIREHSSQKRGDPVYDALIIFWGLVSFPYTTTSCDESDMTYISLKLE